MMPSLELYLLIFVYCVILEPPKSALKVFRGLGKCVEIAEISLYGEEGRKWYFGVGVYRDHIFCVRVFVSFFLLPGRRKQFQISQ